MKLKKVKSKIPGTTEISPSCSAAVYRMGRQEITHNAIWFHPQCTLDGIVYMCEYCVCGPEGGGILQLKNHKVYVSIVCVDGGGVICNWKITKYQDLPKYEFSRGGVICNWKITKYQDLPKYEFSKRGRGGGNLQLKSQSAKISDNFPLGGGYSATEKSQSTKKCLNFNGGG